MRARHLGHRSEIRTGAEENIMKHFQLTIIASVEPDQPWTNKKLDELEGRFQKNLMTMDYNGGIDIRDEVKRRRVGS